MMRVLTTLVKSPKLQDLEKDMKRAEQTLQTGLLRQLWLASQSAAQERRKPTKCQDERGLSAV
ncbi:hypothetical protein QBC32DRAFT_48992 [Pseudoneurospora amorphoporcata]|uniref:Uncharacterized protein n=1 Tax=Pseudoneurospora amorphoporcata TaxID=241081 RepID=A0AAN6NMY6_9PEZI|nr:hypothetical protein QBC32DRAFT_48992 [Pseudoneurospora amorphoporcata]